MTSLLIPNFFFRLGELVAGECFPSEVEAIRNGEHNAARQRVGPFFSSTLSIDNLSDVGEVPEHIYGIQLKIQSAF